MAAACATCGAFRLFGATFYAELAGIGGATGACPSVSIRNARGGLLSSGRTACNRFQCAPQFIRLPLQLPVGVGIGAVGPFVAQFKSDFVKIGGVDGDGDVEPILTLIPGRVVADFFALGVFLIQFRLVFFHLQLALDRKSVV